MSILHAEFTKFRTVRGWMFALVVAAAAIVGLGVAPGMSGTCDPCRPPTGPDGDVVVDSFTFVHRPLTGDGSVTVHVAELTGKLLVPGGGPKLVPWAKAGLIVKDGTTPGSAYAAVLVTGAHGVRMQWNYEHDRAGDPDARWLRLTRAGNTLVGASSPDGTTWSTVDTVRLELPETVQIGLFVTSPQWAEVSGRLGVTGGPTSATAVFDHVDGVEGYTIDGRPAGPDGGAPAGDEPPGAGEHARAGAGDGVTEPIDGGFRITGSGDIAPQVGGATGLGVPLSRTLIGTFAGLLVVVVVGAVAMTAEFRRGMIRTTLAACPRRGRVLAAKALVVGGVTFAVGLVAAALVVTLGRRVLEHHGVYVVPAPFGTELRLVAGTAGLLAVSAVLAVGLGALLRRGAAAVTVAVAGIVLPYLLSVTALPVEAAKWVLRVAPAAAFAVQQSTPEYYQVANLYVPAEGYFPLPAWAGFAVLLAWTAAVLAAATVHLRRSDP